MIIKFKLTRQINKSKLLLSAWAGPVWPVWTTGLTGWTWYISFRPTTFKSLSLLPTNSLILTTPSFLSARALSLSFPSQALSSSILPLPLNSRPWELRICVGDHLLHVLLPGCCRFQVFVGKKPIKVIKLGVDWSPFLGGSNWFPLVKHIHLHCWTKA